MYIHYTYYKMFAAIFGYNNNNIKIVNETKRPPTWYFIIFNCLKLFVGFEIYF